MSLLPRVVLSVRVLDNQLLREHTLAPANLVNVLTRRILLLLITKLFQFILSGWLPVWIFRQRTPPAECQLGLCDTLCALPDIVTEPK